MLPHKKVLAVCSSKPLQIARSDSQAYRYKEIYISSE